MVAAACKYAASLALSPESGAALEAGGLADISADRKASMNISAASAAGHR
jgi:hypothetical protein